MIVDGGVLSKPDFYFFTSDCTLTNAVIFFAYLIAMLISRKRCKNMPKSQEEKKMIFLITKGRFNSYLGLFWKLDSLLMIEIYARSVAHLKIAKTVNSSQANYVRIVTKLKIAKIVTNTQLTCVQSVAKMTPVRTAKNTGVTVAWLEIIVIWLPLVFFQETHV